MASARPVRSSALPTAAQQVTLRRQATPSAAFVPLPQPSGPPPYRLRLADVLDPDRTAAIDRAGVVRFHCVGDTGGWRDGRPQRGVAEAMVDELHGPSPVDFFYHLGDVVYPHGEEVRDRPAVLCALRDLLGADRRGARQPRRRADAGIARRDAGGPSSRRSAPRPRPCATRRCAATTDGRPAQRLLDAHPRLAVDHRPLHQCPRGRRAATDQVAWLVGELSAAPPEATLIVAMHQPIYSADVVHGSNLELGEMLDECSAPPAACRTRCSPATRTTTSALPAGARPPDPVHGGRERRLSRSATV